MPGKQMLFEIQSKLFWSSSQILQIMSQWQLIGEDRKNKYNIPPG